MMTTETKTPQTGREMLTIHVNDIRESGQHRLEELSADLLTKPVHALRWAGDAFEAASRITVAQWMHDALGNDASLEQMRGEAEKRMRHFAQYLPRSTNPLANLTDEVERVAWMKMLLTIEEAIEHDARAADGAVAERAEQA